jgi:hypothetical protein
MMDAVKKDVEHFYSEDDTFRAIFSEDLTVRVCSMIHTKLFVCCELDDYAFDKRTLSLPLGV